MTVNQHDLGLEPIIERIRAHLTAKYSAREAALARCREAIRHSANAIRAIHRAELDTAETMLTRASALLAESVQALRDHPDILYAGFVNDAQKEYAEARLTLAFIADLPLPAPEDLSVEAPAYLNGLGEAIGELRRYLLDRLREGDLPRCEAILSAMDEVYTYLVTMDYPDAMTGGLRRTTDMVRGVLERTRGDFTSAVVQRRLEDRLAEFQQRLD